MKIPHLIGRVMLHRALYILLLLCAWNSPSILAQGKDDIFTVKNLPVDVTAESALKAREIAMLNGQSMALQKLLSRITLRSDLNRLPKLNDETISQMVAAIAVANEKTSTIRYIANLTVEFHLKSIRNLLLISNVRFSETRSKPTLVLPVFEKSAAKSLFEKNNLWRNAWEELIIDDDTLLPFLLPKGDLEDITTITAQAALAGRNSLLQGIAQRYNVENILVAHAIKNIDVSSDGLPRVTVNLLRFGPRDKSKEIHRYAATVNRDLKTTLTQLAMSVASDQQERWKQRTKLSLGEEESLSASLSLSSLSLWLTVQKRLKGSPLISSFYLRQISRRDAQIVINYLGDIESLVLSLAQLDLNLAKVDGFWILNFVGGNKTVGRVGSK